jgi:hypothetical protein
MIALLLATLSAVAAEPLPPMSEVVSRKTFETDAFTFDVPTCDRVRALYRDTRPLDAPRTKVLVVTLRNQGDGICLYKGLVLRGNLAGVWSSSQRTPEGTGFFLPPRGELGLRITPDDPKAPRVAIELQIPPGSGTVILTGYGPDDTLPEAAVAR